MPRTAARDGIELQPAQLALILSGIDLSSARQRKRFQHAGGTLENGENQPR